LGSIAANGAQAAAWAACEMLGRCQAAELAVRGVRVANLVAAPEQVAPEEVAAAIEFLASAEASYITGATLHLDGGRSAFAHAAGAAYFDATQVIR
ncbi:SDR family oxidoreductase, partial [Klebsiella pneumoniae]|nr:SDR family oxidoreductase [Klebsiella pneumoniae]